MFRTSITAVIFAITLACGPALCETNVEPAVTTIHAENESNSETGVVNGPLVPQDVRRTGLIPNRVNVFPEASWNWIFVSLFAFFGVCQLATLLYLTLATGKAANAAKNAAEITERTVSEFETPFLFPVLISSTIWEDLQRLNNQADSLSAQSSRVSFTVKNFGRTPALLQKATAVLYFGELDEAHNDVLSERITELMLEPQGTLVRPIDREIVQPIDRDALLSLKEGKARIYLRGRIAFLDVQGNRYEQIFCLSWDIETGACIPWGPQRNRRKRLSNKRRRLS